MKTMANALFNQIGQQQIMNNPMMNVVKQIQDFKKTFTGDPKSQVEQMLKDGRLTQAQFNQLAQQTNQISQFMAMMPKS